MDLFKIKKETRTTSGWEYDVEAVSGGETYIYQVQVDEDYYNDLTKLQYPPGELVRKTMKYLFSREDIQIIPSYFNLRDLKKYYPEYEDLVKYS